MHVHTQTFILGPWDQITYAAEQCVDVMFTCQFPQLLHNSSDTLMYWEDFCRIMGVKQKLIRCSLSKAFYGLIYCFLILCLHWGSAKRNVLWCLNFLNQSDSIQILFSSGTWSHLQWNAACILPVPFFLCCSLLEQQHVQPGHYETWQAESVIGRSLDLIRTVVERHMQCKMRPSWTIPTTLSTALWQVRDVYNWHHCLISLCCSTERKWLMNWTTEHILSLLLFITNYNCYY